MAFTMLEAVNILLQSIGEDKVNSLTSGFADAYTAQDIITQNNKVVQTSGWWFNREFNLVLLPDENGERQIPKETLSIYFQEGNRYVQRGLRVYDKTGRTYKIPTDTTITADLVLELPFEDLPQSAQNYVILKAARVFQDRVLGNSSLHGYTQQDETDSLLALKEDEGMNAGYNVYNNAELQQRLDRTPYQHGVWGSLVRQQRL